MYELPNHLRPHQDPVAQSEAIPKYHEIRVTVMTASQLRIEISETESFEDKASQLFLFRRPPVPIFDVRKGDN